jgi:hypothetical protein
MIWFLGARCQCIHGPSSNVQRLFDKIHRRLVYDIFTPRDLRYKR